MRICITLDDVLRAKTMQFGKIYKKYIDQNINLEELDLSSGNLQNIFGFEDKKEYERFLYEDYAFEIFGEAPECDKMLSKTLNLWLLRLEDDDDIAEQGIDLILSNTMEFNQSIGCTHFFLSRIAPRIRKTFFPKDSNEIWDVCDILITADKKLLANKPEGKIVIRINTDYNKNTQCVYQYDSLMAFLKDDEIINKLFKKE